jgi:hypothetical protein
LLGTGGVRGAVSKVFPPTASGSRFLVRIAVWGTPEQGCSGGSHTA